MLKTLRDIRETIGSFISILIIIFIGCFFFAGIAQGAAAITDQVNDYYAAQNLADDRAEYMFVNNAAIAEIESDATVEKAMGCDTFHTKARVDGVRYDMTLTTLTPGIDDPYLIDGRLPEKGKNEIIIDEVFAKAHGVELGATIEFTVDTINKITLFVADDTQGGGTPKYAPENIKRDYVFTVTGIYHSPDTIFKVNMMNTSDGTDAFIMAYINHGDVALYTDDAAVYFGGVPMPIFGFSQIAESTVIYNGVKAISKNGKSIDEELFKKYTVTSEDGLREIFAAPDKPAGLYMYRLERENFPSVAAFDNINDMIAALVAILPIIFFAVAAAITVISLTKTVDNQRMQIGIIQGLGISKGNVYFSYIFYALFASVVGSVAGGLVGIFFVPYLLDLIYKRQFCMPPTPWHTGALYMVIGIAISAGLACLAAFLSCYKTLKVAPAQAMRPKPPKKTKRILAERWTALWSRLGFGAKMNLRNMFLHKLKMLFSSIGIVGCLCLLVALIGLKDNMDMSFRSYEAQTGYDMTIVSDTAVDLTDESIYDAIAGADGEEYMHNLTFVPDFSGHFEFNGKTADLTVMALPTYADEKNYRYADADCVKLYTDIYGRNRLLFTPDTFVIPEMLADKLGAKAGDSVKVTGYSLDNRSVEFEITITAIVCEYFDQKAYCAYDVFKNNGVGLFADKSYATLLPGVKPEDAIKSLENNEAVRGVATFKETFDALKKQMSLLDYAVIIFVVGAAALAIAVIYNITATNLKERTREIATLMVLGYKRNETANMIIVENMVITGLGCVLGLPLGYALLRWLVYLTTSFNVFISSFLSWYVVIGCVALTFVFSLIATLLLNTKMKKISMVESLKSVE